MMNMTKEMSNNDSKIDFLSLNLKRLFPLLIFSTYVYFCCIVFKDLISFRDPRHLKYSPESLTSLFRHPDLL